MKKCVNCSKEIQDNAVKCRYCGEWQRKDSPEMLENIRKANKISLGGGLGKSMGLFMAANVGVMLVLMAVVRVFDPGAGFGTAILLLLIGGAIPFGMLFLSKFLAKCMYDIRIITAEEAADEQEKYLLSLVQTLADRANLPAVPEVGIYESDEMNAFATGASQKNSMIAFSSGLLKKMNKDEIAGVAAHETAHIANNDMLTMTLLQGLVNVFVIVIDFALEQMDWYEELCKKSRFLSWIVHFIIVNVLFLLGDLVLLWFSRHREFAADATAASLVGRDTMALALHSLTLDENAGSETAADAPAAAMMISAPAGWADVLSTHPSLERRIEALLADNGE